MGLARSWIWIKAETRRYAESAECFAAFHLATAFSHVLTAHSLPDTS
jgi:hypothetical protein